jgi:nucleotide-binding universal stress UspA family protein
MKHQNIAIAVPLEDELVEPIHRWGDGFNWSYVDEVHFIHVVKKNMTPLEFGMMELPDENAYREMIPVLTNFLKDESKKILPSNYKGKVFFHLASDFTPEEEILGILKKIGSTLLVVATHDRHGLSALFHSSFSEHMIHNAPCDVFVVRPDPDFTQSASGSA